MFVVSSRKFVFFEDSVTNEVCSRRPKRDLCSPVVRECVRGPCAVTCSFVISPFCSTVQQLF
jgi:hypothetical protein